MRRFLYPLSVLIDGDFDTTSIRVAEENGQLVPSQAQEISGYEQGGALRVANYVDFAISMAPNETRRLLVVETDEPPVVPDPITLTEYPDGSLAASQERFSHKIDSAGHISSVIYNGVEHLTGPATITLDDNEALQTLRKDVRIGGGLGSVVRFAGDYPRASGALPCATIYQFTACKSWINITHHVNPLPEGARVTFTLPTTITGGATCDFGVGNGLYGKLAPGSIERIVWHTDLTEPPAKWWIGSCALDSPTVRIDAEGTEPVGTTGLGAAGWFHLIARDKALAVAFETDPTIASTVVVGLGADGVAKITFTMNGAKKAATFRVWYHFLDDIPPIAAATNPASILCPPTVTVLPA